MKHVAIFWVSFTYGWTDGQPVSDGSGLVGLRTRSKSLKSARSFPNIPPTPSVGLIYFI